MKNKILILYFMVVGSWAFAANPPGPQNPQLGIQQIISMIGNYVPLAGGSMTGGLSITINGTTANLTEVHNVGLGGTITTSNFWLVNCHGDNTTFIGCGNIYEQAADDNTVTASNKGVLYGHQSSIRPVVSRNNSPADDADGLVISNDSPNGSYGTEAIYIGHNQAVFGSNKEWGCAGACTDANGDTAFYGTGYYFWGIDFCRTGPACAHISQGPIVGPLITHADNDTCKVGVMAWDASFIYVCTATNTWSRAALSSF